MLNRKSKERNYNEYGVCSRKRGRPGKDGSIPVNS